VLPADLATPGLVDGGAVIPRGAQVGARWHHTSDRFGVGAMFFDGPNREATIRLLPLISSDVGFAQTSATQIVRLFPTIRTYGTDVVVPGNLVNVKGEAVYFTSPEHTGDEYVLYVGELEHRWGHWLVEGGYAGEYLTKDRSEFSFDEDRGLAKSLIGRAAYGDDPRRSVTFDGAVRQNGNGLYLRGEYSEFLSAHWRATFTLVGVHGQDADFIGQFHRNSSGVVALRMMF
jgi:hypothetical protein